MAGGVLAHQSTTAIPATSTNPSLHDTEYNYGLLACTAVVQCCSAGTRQTSLATSTPPCTVGQQQLLAWMLQAVNDKEVPLVRLALQENLSAYRRSAECQGYSRRRQVCGATPSTTGAILEQQMRSYRRDRGQRSRQRVCSPVLQADVPGSSLPSTQSQKSSLTLAHGTVDSPQDRPPRLFASVYLPA